jgi:transglutaminase-like putative cysteine protease
MLRNSLGLIHSEALDLVSPEARTTWMRETQQLDIVSPTVRSLADQITHKLSGSRNKAVAIHDHVKTLPFACVAQFVHTKASEIIRLGHGDCHSKGVLFVALLRAVSVPARMRFVTLPTRFLTGVIDTGSHTMIHAIAEVYLDTRWYQTDTYVVDAALSREARALLRLTNTQQGYGVHLQGDQDWNGFDDAHAQSTAHDPSSLPLVDWGVAHDPAHFYADTTHAALRQSFSMRMKWMLGAQLVNRKVQQIRQGRHGHAGGAVPSRSSA